MNIFYIMMKQVKETEKLLIFEELKKGKIITYRQHKEDVDKHKIEIYTKIEENFYYPFEGNSIKTIILKGFNEIPNILSSYGYGFTESSLNSFFKYKFINQAIDTLIIVDDFYLKGKYKKSEIVFSLEDFENLITSLNQEQRACNDTKTILTSNFIIENYPKVDLEYKETNNNKNLILRNLNSKLIEKLTADDVEKFGQFYVEATKKYTRSDIVKRMIVDLQKNAQLITLQEIIKIYEKLLKDDPAESAWQTFFNSYITLFDNRYAYKLDYKNIATGITKFPDLVLVDIYGYIDFYELKKSGMPLLQFDNSHKTYYWSKELSKTIAQASDYLQKARENSVNYAKSIKEETATEHDSGLDVSIINPRAIIVAGSTKELNNSKKLNHFKNLRESLKDIEFVLYDELLDRLKNLVNLIKLD
ncbi:Shedu immune nuclease family protein [Flavobacterium sp. MK4S-17]|uniref:Shedu immune nuclease family protein n=1 Tax=Flavobacterium sp. MK4S-17 TaxID=2543737 RepID=UPI001357A9DD|nr:Shedu immune nuclease family protein [Flavobacterium sp. MK4S-17]